MSVDTVITGQAVVLHLQPGNFINRGVAFIIDTVCYITGLIGTLWAMSALDVFIVLDDDAFRALMLTVMLSWMVLIPGAIEIMSGGRSVGKLVMGLRVVRDDGGAIRFRHTVARVLAGVFELWIMLGSVAAIASFLNAKGKRLGDMLAGSYVMTVRSPKIPPQLPDVPEHMRAWASVADVGRLPDGLVVDINQFLRTRNRMTPQAAAHHAQRLLTLVSPYVTPGPESLRPPVPPEVFLHAVVAERRNRDYATLMRRRESQRKLAEHIGR